MAICLGCAGAVRLCSVLLLCASGTEAASILLPLGSALKPISKKLSWSVRS